MKSYTGDGASDSLGSLFLPTTSDASGLISSPVIYSGCDLATILSLPTAQAFTIPASGVFNDHGRSRQLRSRAWCVGLYSLSAPRIDSWVQDPLRSVNRTTIHRMRQQRSSKVHGSRVAINAIHSDQIPLAHPFFMKPEEKRALDASSNSAFQWLKSLGTQGSCLHGINLQPAATSKVAALDLDGTLIKQEFGKSNFAWWNSRVPQKLRDLHGSG